MGNSLDTGMRISSRMKEVKTSKIYELISKVIDLNARGIVVHALTAGEPDFDTPEHIITAAKEAMRAGDTHYTPVRGSLEVREAVLNKFSRENGLNFEDSNIMVATGSKQIIANAFAVTLEPGQEVLLPTPYWAAYTGMIYAAGGVPAYAITSRENGYKLTPELLRNSITPKTRWLVLNTPSNPCGIIYSTQELVQLGKVLEEFPNVYILSDEIYEKLNYSDERHASIAKTCPALANRIIIANGVSKAYAMTGWRLGYGAGPSDIINAMADYQSQTTLGPSSISQAAAVAALNGPTDSLERMVNSYRSRRDLVTEIISTTNKIHMHSPEGAFYALLDVSDSLNNSTMFKNSQRKDEDFAAWLLDTHRVAVVPGSPFGAPGTVRVSFATDRETIEKGLGKLIKAVEQI
jgi:aspartate/methionine/tyrosine aminotransferase